MKLLWTKSKPLMLHQGDISTWRPLTGLYICEIIGYFSSLSGCQDAIIFNYLHLIISSTCKSNVHSTTFVIKKKILCKVVGFSSNTHKYRGLNFAGAYWSYIFKITNNIPHEQLIFFYYVFFFLLFFLHRYNGIAHIVTTDSVCDIHKENQLHIWTLLYYWIIEHIDNLRDVKSVHEKIIKFTQPH